MNSFENAPQGNDRSRENERAAIEIVEERMESVRILKSNESDLQGLIPGDALRIPKSYELDLQGLELTALPDSIGSLKHLQLLSANSNRLTMLPEAICQLSQLQTLYIAHNQLTVLPDAICHLSNLRDLSVISNQLTGLPMEFGNLGQLRILNANGNKLKTLPDTFGRLTQLEHLNASNNQLSSLPENFGDLSQLQSLFLNNNELKVLPESLRRLKNLKQLFLHGNPGLNLPPEVLGPTPEEIKESGGHRQPNPASILEFYFSNRRSRPLNEAKMIFVGRGGVGKTSLVNRLLHKPHNSSETKTDGIAITPWEVRIGEDQIRLNIWDFGGQEIMHATHQFFLTKRSLYLLVLNAREAEQDTNVEYWLRLIESFSGGSPVLVIINKIKDHPFDLNRRGLQAKFPAICDFVQTDCEENIGIEKLRQIIVRETNLLQHLRDPFPISWFKIKTILANLPNSENRNFIPFVRYQQMCVEHGVTEATSQETLVGFLHDLGIVVNFRDDPRLADTHVLNPKWVTTGIYKILTAETLANKRGELRLSDLAHILDGQDYPRQMHLYLMDLMRKFELCYEFYDSVGHYLVPELLGKEEPDLNTFEPAAALRFEYRYNVLPEGLLPRFIVRSRVLNQDLPRWRTGVVLRWEDSNAVIKADVQDRIVSITVLGPTLASQQRLLAVIRADMEHIHRSISKLRAEERVPIPWYPGLSVEYATLRVFEDERETEIKLVHDGKLLKFNIARLLAGLEETPVHPRESMDDTIGNNAVRVAFSYSHKDEELRDQLEIHLKLLQHKGIITTWHDRKIVPGDKWGRVIDDNFKRADMILLLVSADFMASDYCYGIEVKTALSRHASAGTIVIPVILRACDWQDAPFGKLQALPKDGAPVTSWPNRDEAWHDVAKGIKRIAEEIRLSQA